MKSLRQQRHTTDIFRPEKLTWAGSGEQKMDLPYVMEDCWIAYEHIGLIKRVHIGLNLQLDLHRQWWILHTNNLPCYNDDSLNKSRILRFSSKHSHQLHIQVSSMSMYMDSYKAIHLKDTCNTTCIFIRFYA